MDAGDVTGDGVPEIAVGCDDTSVYLLSSTGEQLWSFRCEATTGTIGLPPQVDWVRIADLEGDGRPEIVAGANQVHCLDAAGDLKWERYLRFARGMTCGDFLHGAIADLDGDGVLDLVLPNRVYLRRGDGFGPGVNIPPHPAGEAEHVDLLGDTLFLLSTTGLRVVQREGDAWRVDHQEMDPLPEGYAFPPSGLRQWARFLQDVQGDGMPEILLAGERGLYVYVHDPDGAAPPWKCVMTAPIYPALRLAGAGANALWPPTQRRLDLPTREMTCRLYIRNDLVTVRTREEQDDLRVRYRTYAYRIAEGEAGSNALVCRRVSESLSPAMPAFVQPCLLAPDAHPTAYAGGRWEWLPHQPMPAPVFETVVSTDGGSTFRTVRVRGLRPACSFVDFDGDGYADLVTEQTGLLDGGVRETVSRFLTDATVEHTVQIYRQDPTTRTFASEPTVSERFSIDLGAPPVHGSEMYHRYRSAELLLLNGDINGDGVLDFVVQDRPDRIAIYYGAADGARSSAGSLRSLLSFGRTARTPDVVLPILPGRRFSVADVDGDGRSDVIVRWMPPDGAAERSLAYLSRGED